MFLPSTATELFKYHIVPSFLFVLGSYSILRLANLIIETREFRNWAAANGCESGPTIYTNFFSKIRYKLKLGTGKDMLEGLMKPKYEKFGYTHCVKDNFTSKVLSVSTAEPENIKHIHFTAQQDFARTPISLAAPRKWLGVGVFNSVEPAWAHSRKLLLPMFANNRLRNNVASIDEHIDIMLSRITNEQDRWSREVKMLDLTKYASQYPLGTFEASEITDSPRLFTLDTITEFMFGTSSASQAARLAQSSPVAAPDHALIRLSDTFDYLSEFIARRIVLGYRYYWLLDGFKFRAACAEQHSYVDAYITKARAGLQMKATTDHKRLFAGYEAGLMNYKELRDATLQAMLGGRDTTFATLANAIAMLSRRPDIYHALRIEVSKHFGGVLTISAQHTNPSFDNLKKLTLIQNIITETIRLFPPSAIQPRVAVRDSILPTGGGTDASKPVAVQKGTIVNYSSYVLHRRKDLWGSDADEWRPEHWEDESLGKDGKLIFIGWGLDRHACLGQQYSTHEMALTLVRIAQRFDKIENLDPYPLPRMLNKLLASPRDNVPVRFHWADVGTAGEVREVRKDR